MAIPAKKPLQTKLRYDGSPLNSTGIGRVIGTWPRQLCLLGFIAAGYQMVSTSGSYPEVAGRVVGGLISTAVLAGIMAHLRKSGKLQGYDEKFIVIDTSAVTQNNHALAREIYAKSSVLLIKDVMATLGLFAVAIRVLPVVPDPVMILPGSGYVAGLLIRDAQRVICVNGGPHRTSELMRMMPKWSVQYTKPLSP